jgi:hypothetical protein
MSFLLESHYRDILAPPDEKVIGSRSPCFYCGKTLGFYRPVIIFGLQSAEVVGAAHPECGYFDFRYAQFSLAENLVLNRAETGWLAHFYHRLVKLPGQGQSRAILRRCLAGLLPDFPDQLARIPALLNSTIAENPDEVAHYPGDLETDFYLFLGQVQSAAQNAALNVRIDFA